MTALLMDASIILGVVSIGLAGALFLLYRRIYAQTRTGFGLALLIFAAAFVAQSGLTVVSDLSAMPLIPDPLVPFLFLIGLFEAMGLGALLWTASR